MNHHSKPTRVQVFVYVHMTVPSDVNVRCPIPSMQKVIPTNKETLRRYSVLYCVIPIRHDVRGNSVLSVRLYHREPTF